MRHRYFLAVLAVVVVLAPAFAAAQSTASPRTPWGAPDLQGVWDFRSITPLERPDELADKEFLTEEEATSLEQEAVERNSRLLSRPAETTTAGGSVDSRADGSPGFYNNFWLDRGTKTVGTRRTSLIVDPPNGKIPAMTQAAAKRKDTMAMARRGISTHEPTPGGWVDDLGANGLQLRCITGFNSGPPMTPGGYNQNVQLFQTSSYVALLNEMNHNFRIIPLDGRTPAGIPQWTGDSRGHWEDDTLVVETTNFLRETSFRAGVSSNASLACFPRHCCTKPRLMIQPCGRHPGPTRFRCSGMSSRCTNTPVTKATTGSTTSLLAHVPRKRLRRPHRTDRMIGPSHGVRTGLAGLAVSP